MVTVRFVAKDTVDYYEQNQQRNERLGEEGAAIRREILSLCRRFEQSNNTLVRDISYQPAGSN